MWSSAKDDGDGDDVIITSMNTDCYVPVPYLHIIQPAIVSTLNGHFEFEFEFEFESM
jgi:hypothetical protein